MPEEAGAPDTALRGTRCPDCGQVAFPPRPWCASCPEVATEPAPLSTTGVLYSFSVVHVAPPPWPTPYVLAYIDLPEGVRLLSHVETDDIDQLALDTAVTFDGVREAADGATAVFCRPVTEGARS